MLFNTYCVALRLEIILQSSIVTCKEGGNIVVYIQYIGCSTISIKEFQKRIPVYTSLMI